MRISMQKRLAALEVARPPALPTFPDPVTGEEVDFGKIMGFAMIEEMHLLHLIRTRQLGEDDCGCHDDIPAHAREEINAAAPDELDVLFGAVLAPAFARRRAGVDPFGPAWDELKRDFRIAWPIPAEGDA